MVWSADVAATCCATLVDEWVGRGLRFAMVSPGSRSTPMALALAERTEIRLEVFVDERTAAFAALGAALASGVPAVALCTSGTAAVEFHPAAVEADHAGVPIILVTADRPPELIGRGAPQTIDQAALYGVSSRAFLDVGVADDDTAHTWRGLAGRAWTSAAAPRPGPVQLNVPFREPLVGTPRQLPTAVHDPSEPPVPTPSDEDLAALASLVAVEHGVIVAGWGVDDPAAVYSLANRLGWPILADPRSGCRGRASVPEDVAVVRHADPILRVEAVASALRPQAILRLGEPPASKVVNAWMQASGARQIAIDPRGRLIDPERTLERLVHAAVGATCGRLHVGERGTEWAARFARLDELASRAISSTVDPLSEVDVARRVAAAMPAGSSIVASSSMPIRDLEWFADHFGAVRVLSNRGVNGIDGVVSTAIGVAVASDAPVLLLIGDVAFVHDSSALVALARRSVDLRIVVVDNDGGGIFSFLPQADSLPRERFEMLFGTPHGTDIVALASAHGLPAASCLDVAALERLLVTPGPHVVHVRTDRDDNAESHRRIFAAVAEAVGR